MENKNSTMIDIFNEIKNNYSKIADINGTYTNTTDEMRKKFHEKVCGNLYNEDNENDDKNLLKLIFDYDNFILPYTPLKIDNFSRIIAIGDIHGDLNVLKQCLILGKVVNDNDEWIGGETIVVQVGDQLDAKKRVLDDDDYERNFTDLDVISYLTKIDEKARKDGGYVISLLGNHEIMNVFGYDKYVDETDKVLENEKKIKDFYKKKPHKKNKYPSIYEIFNENKIDNQTNSQLRNELFKPGEPLACYLGCTRLPFVIIDKILFIHAGIFNDFLISHGINNIDDFLDFGEVIKLWLLGLCDNNDMFHNLLMHENSPFWTRHLNSNSKNKTRNCNLFFENINNMIVGHTVQQEINKSCNNVWNIDVGMARAFKISTPQILVIENINGKQTFKKLVYDPNNNQNIFTNDKKIKKKNKNKNKKILIDDCNC